jgi:hypothetical protein
VDSPNDVHEPAAAPVWPGGDHDIPALFQQRDAAGEDAGEPVGELVVADVGEVALVVAVPVVDLRDPAVPPAVLADVAMGRAAVRG